MCDARLLVNLHGHPEPGSSLLDPFAGAGGIAVEAAAGGWTVVTSDLDPVLAPGLADLASTHFTADCRELPLPDRSIAAIATEPPYDEGADGVLCESLTTMQRVLVPGAKVTMLAAARQAAAVRLAADRIGWRIWIDEPVDRKGTSVHLLAWIT